MSEWRLFDPASPPGFFTAEWYAQRAHAPHIDQPVHHERLHVAAMLANRAITAGAASIVDLGCGDGGLLSLLRPGTPAHGYDLMPANVEHARNHRRQQVDLADIVQGEPEWADLVVVTEFLEHLEDPHKMVARIAANTRWVVASSPADETDASHDAVHAWAWDRDGYAAMFDAAGITVTGHEITTGGRSFQVLLGETPCMH